MYGYFVGTYITVCYVAVERGSIVVRQTRWLLTRKYNLFQQPDTLQSVNYALYLTLLMSNIFCNIINYKLLFILLYSIVCKINLSLEPQLKQSLSKEQKMLTYSFYFQI